MTSTPTPRPTSVHCPTCRTNGAPHESNDATCRALQDERWAKNGNW